MNDILSVHAVDQLSKLISFLQRENMGFTIDCNNNQSFLRKQTFAVIDNFLDIFKQYFQVEYFMLVTDSHKINPLVSDNKLTVYRSIFDYLAGVSCLQNNLIRV